MLGMHARVCSTMHSYALRKYASVRRLMLDDQAVASTQPHLAHRLAATSGVVVYAMSSQALSAQATY